MHDQLFLGLEIFLEFFCEAILALVCEFGLDLAFEFVARILKKNPITPPPHLLLSPVRQALNRSLRVSLFTLGGALVGLLTLPILPHPIIHSPVCQILNLMITPAILGYVMDLRGKMSQKKKQTVLWLDHYIEGFFFAFGLVLIRYFFTH